MSDSNNSSNKSSPAKSMAELMARSGSNLNVLVKGQMVEGTIKKLTPGEILMDIGAKGDALVIEFDRQKLENLLSILKIGDRVKASVISAESEEGFPNSHHHGTLPGPDIGPDWHTHSVGTGGAAANHHHALRYEGSLRSELENLQHGARQCFHFDAAVRVDHRGHSIQRPRHHV